ncbi:MAG: hypothetical protein H6529_09415 [Nocardioides sp.]|nr:hypothetical protein [Nocardioidaceae bacterium]MCB8956683.1 hypothetical protein [Nocardioides sp.]
MVFWVACGVVVAAVLGLGLWLDHHGGRRSGGRHLDEVRNRIEGSAVMGTDWQPPGHWRP